MVASICGKRVRGDLTGIFTCCFIFCCWVFAFYSANVSIIPLFFDRSGELKSILLAGHIVLSILTLCTMVHCIKSDPGRLQDISNADLLGWEYCDRCQKHRPPRSHHCRRCGYCVRKMDHHCPWINNCVGEDNVANFTQFLFYSMLMSLCTFTLCLAYFFDWLPLCTPCVEDMNLQFSLKIEVICLSFITFAFGAFTAFMFVDRIILISSDVTTLELMTDPNAIRKSCVNSQKPSWFMLFSRAFGSGNVIDWLMPYAKRHIRLSYEYQSYNWQEYV